MLCICIFTCVLRKLSAFEELSAYLTCSGNHRIITCNSDDMSDSFFTVHAVIIAILDLAVEGKCALADNDGNLLACG